MVAAVLPPGEGWRGLAAAAWSAEAALLPVDHRLPEPAVRALLARAEPTVLIDREGWRHQPGGRPADPSVALIVPTSGSTGLPRLVELTRPAVEAAVSASLTALRAGPGDGWVSCLPLAHVGGLLVLLRSLLRGLPLRFSAGDDLAWRDGDAFISAVPTQLVRALDTGLHLSGYRAIVVGGGDMSPDLAQRAATAGARCVVTYGLTQSCGGVVYDGVPLPGVSVRVGPSGEIELGGPTLMRGYRHAAAAIPAAISASVADGGAAEDREQAASAQPRLTADGWLRTGDAGWIDAQGHLRVRGRIDDLIVTGGENVWPQDVEAALRSHPGVSECAVFGRPDPTWGQRVVVAVVARDPGSPPALDALRDHVGAVLGRHQAPRELVVVDSLPRTALGKLRRAGLAAPGGDAGAEG